MSTWEWLHLPARWVAVMTEARRAIDDEIASAREQAAAENRMAQQAEAQAKRTGRGRVG